MAADPDPKSADKPKPKRKPRRWPRRLFFLLLLLGVGVWMAPAVIARTDLRTWVVRKALADLKGTIDVGRADLGWVSPVALYDVTVTDAAGRKVLASPKVTSSLTLWELARANGDYGTFTVHQPVADVVAENGSTNLEAAIANYLADDGTPPGPTRTALTLAFTDGKVTLRDPVAKQEWTFEKVDIAITSPRPRAEPVRLAVAGTVVGASPGAVRTELAFGDTGTATVKADSLPLEPLAPFMARFAPGLAVAGRLTSDLSAEWGENAGKPTFKLDGSASVANLDLSGPRLKGDHFKLASASLPVKLRTVGSLLTVERAELTCDVGMLSAVGTFDPADPADQIADRAGVQVTADVDLAKLAALVPRLLRVREDTEIREGKLHATLASRVGPAGVVWDGAVRTSALKAVRGGQPIDWDEPLTVEFAMRPVAGGLPVFDKLTCQSDFIAVNARGSAESFQAAANIYLDELAERLGEFVDLGGLRLDGEASVTVRMARGADGQFRTDGAVILKRFEVTDAAGAGLKEPDLQLKAEAAGRVPKDGPIRLDTGTLSVIAGADRLDLQLLEPVADVKQLAAGKLQAALTGDLARWRTRLGGLVSVPDDWQLGGSGTVAATVRFEQDRLSADGVRADLTAARFVGSGIDLSEPKLTAQGDVHYAAGTGVTAVENLRLAATSFTVSSPKLTATPLPSGATALDGNGTLTADLNGLQRLFRMQADPAGGDAVHGRAVGGFRFHMAGGKTTFAGDADVKGFVYGPLPAPLWAEPEVKFVVDGELDPPAQAVRLTRLRAERDGLAVDGKGTLTKLATTQDVAVEGNLSYDLAKLTPQFRQWLGVGFQANGAGTRPFTLTGSVVPGAKSVAVSVGTPRPGGPVVLRAPTTAVPPSSVAPFTLAGLTGQAGVGWQAVKAYGFDVGPGEATIKLTNGAMTSNQIEAAFGGGKVRITPTLRLEPGPADLSFAKGLVVERTKLTPAACAGAIGYALPAIANAAQAEGDVSFVLDDNRIPLTDPTRTTARGSLIVHKATVSAGPVVTEVAKLLGAPGTTVTLANEMTVPVRVQSGRVHHENMALTVNGYTVKTTGSVGFDGTVSLVADVPLPASLFKNNPKVGAVLANRVVQVPVGGTLAKPAVDAGAFQAAVARLVQGAARDVGKDFIEKKLEGGLNKLLPQPPAKK